MPSRTRYPVVLHPEQAAFLQRLARSRKLPARQRTAAAILLARAREAPVRQVAAELHCSTSRVVAVCRRFVESGWDGVHQERPRGRPVAYSDADRERLLEWAGATPQALGLPVTRWSLAWLQTCWRRHLRRPAPARSTLFRWLHEARIPWARTRSWCRSNDPDYATKLGAVCDAYLDSDRSVAVLCYDQKPHVQALSRRHRVRGARPAKPGQRDHDYRRHGTLCLHALLDVRSGRCQVACREGHDAATIARLLAGWCRRRPEAKVVLVMDNLSANHAPAVQAALAGCGKEVTVLRTPTYSSWANQVEAVFSHLQRQLLDNLESWSTEHLARQLRGWFQSWNAQARPFRWTYHPDSVLCGTAH
jgi:transposase